MDQLRIEAYQVPEKPDYRPLARHLINRIIEFYEDPENVKACEEWRKERYGDGVQELKHDSGA